MIKMTLSQPEIKMKISPAKVVYQGGGSGNVYSADINRIVTIDRAEYDALAAKDKKTLYLIRG